ncbi:chaperone protein : Uncharacterized protein OS=Actinopolyspora erythraea GN=IL38_23725 PE=4 SV=1: Tet_JBP [Gemmata massiliana]|uniref:2OGFeDO JBP1/TET oxygenase domain-containing protein n=1 Tax=Gemmata massiliana TaxID=1210884 RepID=A0A6P2DJI1_9BACT|nr:hypothetical protein [Gemmata massiliana]VTS01586.1 chaperone protein : Uncharacterized protein OS=Actinopolyspora erythraea GN=IL38_23725 PE=4 SV=1: Tet_JBP [Gemmata massiliana]
MNKFLPKIISFTQAPLTASEADSLNGMCLYDRHYDTANVIRGTSGNGTLVCKENGELLLAYLPGAVRDLLTGDLINALRRAATETHNRGSAADGRVFSGIIGYYDRYTRWPYCRITRFTRDDRTGWSTILPLIGRMGEAYRDAVPDRYRAQHAFVEVTSPDFRIEGTPFTTATVNRNLQFNAHRDKGNLKLGTVVMCVPKASGYTGGLLVFPKYRLGVDARAGDVVLFDGDEYHGNTALVPTASTFERISVVCYYRSAMIHCGTAEEEHERAKRRKPGDPLH